MKKIAIFCIPAHGHTNPVLPVAAELIKRGNTVRFYSFDEFEKKIRAVGAEFVSCDSFMDMTESVESKLKSVSITEMTIQDIRMTLRMDSFLDSEFKSFMPDVVYTDSVCFWGKLSAWKHSVPMVVSTSTFAFNQLSSGYMKNSFKDLAGMISGIPRISKELKTLEPYGYHVKNVLSLVQSDNETDSVVYTSRRFQPYAESFSDKYAFVGPSVFSKAKPCKEKERPLVYVSMGTVINDRPEFYKNCINALKNQNVDMIISCGKSVDMAEFGVLPDNVHVYPYVDQLDILSKADVFVTHCGMNSVSESLYMATPMVLYPQTNEQRAVARRVTEINAGVMLDRDSSEGILAAVRKILEGSGYEDAAEACCADFRSCTGPEGAAEFIENAPNSQGGTEILSELSAAGKRFLPVYWLVALAVMIALGVFVGCKYLWVAGIAFGVMSAPVNRAIREKKYNSLTKKLKR